MLPEEPEKPSPSSTQPPLAFEWRPAAESLGEGVRFLTRLPVPFLQREATREPTHVAAVAWTFPVIGALVGLVSGIVYVAGTELRLGAFAASVLAVGAGIVLTGALHEDGLADTIDGFGGGQTATAKLEIMRDSRIGTFGALGLLFSILLRVGALVALSPLGPWRVLLVLIAAEAVARAAMVRLWQELPAVRAEGLSAGGHPDDQQATLAIAAGLVLVLITALPAAGLPAAVWGTIGAAAATVVFTRLCRNQIGGQTGDTLGAVEQLSLTSFLLLSAAFI